MKEDLEYATASVGESRNVNTKSEPVREEPD